MPINYKNYPANWKSEIRPAILQRAGNKCEFCGVSNKMFIFRGILEDGLAVYQDADANIYKAENSELLFINDYDTVIKHKGEDKAIKVVLTIAHLNHDNTNNDYSNLAALCQKCHLNYDAKQHASTRIAKRNIHQLKLEL